MENFVAHMIPKKSNKARIGPCVMENEITGNASILIPFPISRFKEGATVREGTKKFRFVTLWFTYEDYWWKSSDDEEEERHVVDS